MPEEAFRTDFDLPSTSLEGHAVEEFQEKGAKKWDLLLDGALPAACSLVESPCDPEIKFYALGALTMALQRIHKHLQVHHLQAVTW